MIQTMIQTMTQTMKVEMDRLLLHLYPEVDLEVDLYHLLHLDPEVDPGRNLKEKEWRVLPQELILEDLTKPIILALVVSFRQKRIKQGLNGVVSRKVCANISCAFHIPSLKRGFRKTARAR